MFKDFKEIFGGFRKILKLLHRKEKSTLIFASIFMLAASILVNFPAVVLGKFVDRLINAQVADFNAAIPYLTIIVLAIIFKEIFTVIRKYLVENIATQTEKKQTVNAIEHLLKVDIDYVANHRIGSLHGKIFRSIQGLIKLIKLSFLDFFPVLFSAIAALVIVFVQKPALASFMILVIPAGLLIIIKQISSQKGIRIDLLRGKEEIDGKVVEMLGGLETIRVSNTEDQELTKIDEVAEKLRKKEIKHHIWMAFYDSLKYFNESFFYVLVITISIYFSIKGVITKGDIITYSMLFMSVISPLREMHRILDEAHESSIKVNDLENILSEPLDQSYITGDKKIVRESEIILSVKNLNFKYPGKKDKVLQNINLDIKKGEKIGIAGYSGCGKSTFIKIILRLIHGYQGKIFLKDTDLKKISRSELADMIAYVPQSTYIFSGTIRENLTYGCRGRISEDEIVKAAKLANIFDEIMAKPEGLDGLVAENGKNLSGGQKQRIAIVRLILKSPDILIFDEATSALDNINESIIQKNISELFFDKTIITIAHRLTTLRDMDRILVFDNGEIIQEGRFVDLSKIKGKFKEFIEQKI